jgi:hypothetical protein
MTTPTPGLDEILAKFRESPNGGARATAELSIEVVLGQLARHFEWTRQETYRAWQAAQILPFPAQLYTVTGGVPGIPTFAADANAPKDGYAWFATRLSVDGLVPGTGLAQYQSNSVTSPGAAATIVQITAANLAPGNYLVYVTLSLAGTLAAGDGSNMQISGPGTGGSKPFQFPPQAGEYTFGPIYLSVPAGNGTALKISSIAAGTVGVIYGASLDLVPQPADQVQLYRGPAIAVAAQPQNRIHTFTAGGSAGPGPDWTPGGRGLMMRHQDAVILSGSGLSAASLVLSGDVIQLEERYVPRYLAGLG